MFLSDPIFDYFAQRPDLPQKERLCARLEALTDMANDLPEDADEKEEEEEAPAPFQVMQHLLTGIDLQNRTIGLVMLPSANDDKGGPRPTIMLTEKHAVEFIAHMQHLLRRLSQRPL